MLARKFSSHPEKSTDLYSKHKIIAKFQQFRGIHDLGSDPDYDDLLADIIIDEFHSLDMQTAIAALANKFYPDNPDKPQQEKKRQKLILQLNETLYLRIFSRIKRHADINKYDAQHYYTLGMEHNDILKYQNGDKSRDIIAACKNLYASFFSTLDNYNKTPSSADLQYDDPNKEHSLVSDTIESITGLTDKALTAGSKITSGSVVYSGNSTHFHVIAAQVFSIGSFIINIIDFLLIPMGYLYKFIKKETVPFNTPNNIRWALATISLILAITSYLFPPAALGIAITSATITLAVSTITFVKFFYNRYKINLEREALKEQIRTLKTNINQDQEDAYRIRKQIRIHMMSANPQVNVIDRLNNQLTEINERFLEHSELFKELKKHKKMLNIAHHQHQSYAELGSNLIKLLLSGMVIAGAILIANPVTAPLAIGLAASAAIIGLGIMVVKKILQVRHKRKERKLEKDLGHTTTIKFDTTASMMEKLFNNKEIQPLTNHEQVDKIIKRLLHVTKDNNPASVLNFFIICERKLISRNIPEKNFEEIFYEIPNDLQTKTFELLEKGIQLVRNGELFLRAEEKEALERTGKLYTLFRNNGIDVNFRKASIYSPQKPDLSDTETKPLLEEDELASELRY